jgi:hypothetical protein
MKRHRKPMRFIADGLNQVEDRRETVQRESARSSAPRRSELVAGAHGDDRVLKWGGQSCLQPPFEGALRVRAALNQRGSPQSARAILVVLGSPASSRNEIDA